MGVLKKNGFVSLFFIFLSCVANAEEMAVFDEDQPGLDESYNGSPELLQKIKNILALDFPDNVKRLWESGKYEEAALSVEPLKSSLLTNDVYSGMQIINIDDAYFSLKNKWNASHDGVSLEKLYDSDGSHKFVLSINTCWVNPGADYKRKMNLVESAVKSTWGYWGRVAFTGWKNCSEVPKNERGISIKIEDSHPSSWRGVESLEHYPSMHLNLSLNDVYLSEKCTTNMFAKDQCIWSVAVHEFGHALGLLHEQDREDTPSACREQYEKSFISSALAPVKLTKWDEKSVMNYCYDIYLERIQLSECDIAALHEIYGKPANRRSSTCRVNDFRGK